MNLQTLSKYKSWADHLLYESLGALPVEELERDRLMLFSSILSLLNHVYAMDVAWKHNLEGIAHNMQSRNPAMVPTFIELRENQKEINIWYEEYVDRQSDEQLTASVDFSFIGGKSGRMSKSGIIHHVVNHASYHRGHIEGVMYQMSVEPPTTDIPVYLQLSESGNAI